MRLKQQYQELIRLKKEINLRLERGTDFQNMKELMLYLAHDSAYASLKLSENQMIMLECFFNIWLKEKKLLPELGIEADVFDRITCLDDVERKYRKVQYCGLRIENAVPEEYCNLALEWLIEEKLSGLAIGKIVVFETKEREKNLIYIARWLKEKGDILTALMLLQYANEVFPEQEELLWEEADIWFAGQQWERAEEILGKIKNPSQRTKELIRKTEQVTGNDR